MFRCHLGCILQHSVGLFPYNGCHSRRLLLGRSFCCILLLLIFVEKRMSVCVQSLIYYRCPSRDLLLKLGLVTCYLQYRRVPINVNKCKLVVGDEKTLLINVHEWVYEGHSSGNFLSSEFVELSPLKSNCYFTLIRIYNKKYNIMKINLI